MLSRIWHAFVAKAFPPHDPYATGQWAVRCNCGAYFWVSNQEILKDHAGHLYTPVRNTTFRTYCYLRWITPKTAKAGDRNE